jgi:hypothetical protein
VPNARGLCGLIEQREREPHFAVCRKSRIRWEDANDGVGSAIEGYGSADGIGITAEVCSPGGCAENGDVVLAGRVVLLVEEAAGNGRDSEQREEIARCENTMQLFRMAVDQERNGGGVDGGVGGDLAEACLLAAPVEIVGVGGFDAALHARIDLGDGDDAALVGER